MITAPTTPRPYTLIAELTYRCPLRCPYCSNPMDYLAHKSELSTEEWSRVFEQAEELGVVQLHLTGGEPLARKDLELLAARARELGLYVNLVTSGIPLRTDTSRDSVLAVMGTGPLVGTGVDTLRMAHGFRRQAFMVAGAQYEVLWYRDTPGTLDDPILKERETPLVIEDNKLKGLGWSFYDKLAQEKNLPNPSLSKQRLDSIVQSQQPKKP